MKRLVVILLCISFVLSSCAGNIQDNKVYDAFIAKISNDISEMPDLDKTVSRADEAVVSRTSYKASPDAVTTKTLTITASISPSYLEKNIQSFVDIHPDVEIILENYADIWDYTDVFPVLLMTKKYGDIVLPVYCDPKLINGSSFEDLYPYINRADFDKNNYYMHILTADSINDKLFTIPAVFFPLNIYTMRTDIAPEYVDVFLNKEDLNYNDLVRMYLDIAAEARNCGEKFEILFDGGFNPVEFLVNNLDSLIDFENKKAKFTDPEFMELMERVKNEVYYGDNLVYTENGMKFSPFYDFHDPYDLNECVDENQRVLFSVAGYSLMVSAPLKGRRYTVARQIPTAAGNYYFSPYVSMTISKHSQDKELAWEFIKYYISDKEIPEVEGSNNYVYCYRKWVYYALLTIGCPWTVNKTNFERMLPLERDFRKEELKEDYRNLTLEGDYDEYYRKWYLPFVRKTMENYNKTYSASHGLFKYYSRGIIWDDMYLYLMNKQTVEQTMQNIENKVNIWLNE